MTEIALFQLVSGLPLILLWIATLGTGGVLALRGHWLTGALLALAALIHLCSMSMVVLTFQFWSLHSLLSGYGVSLFTNLADGLGWLLLVIVVFIGRPSKVIEPSDE